MLFQASTLTAFCALSVAHATGDDGNSKQTGLRLAQDKSETDRGLGVGLATLRRVGAQLSLSSLAPLLEVRMDSVKVAWNKRVLTAKPFVGFPITLFCSCTRSTVLLR